MIFALDGPDLPEEALVTSKLIIKLLGHIDEWHPWLRSNNGLMGAHVLCSPSIIRAVKQTTRPGSQQQTGDGSWVPGCWLELSTILREVSQCPEMAPIRTLSLLKVPVQMLVHKVSQFD